MMTTKAPKKARATRASVPPFEASAAPGGSAGAPPTPAPPAKKRRLPFAGNQLLDPATGAPRDPGARIWKDVALFPGNTAGPVDRRWQIATRTLEDAECDRVLRRDAWTNRARDYLSALHACHTDAERDALAATMPDIDAAYRLHEGDKLTRATVEGLLLARQSIDQVASECGLTPAALTAYVALFFDVLGRLHAAEYILLNALGGNIWDGSLTEADGDVFVRLLGYQGGPILLRWAVAYFRGGWSVPECLEDASPDQLRELVGILNTRAIVLVHVLPYRQCIRAVRLARLVGELRAYLASRTDQAPPVQAADDLEPYASLPLLGAPINASVEPTPGVTAPIGTDGWWSAWRQALQAA
jgi:hypothetical protein